jgi:protein-disulfide isomerase
MDYPLDGLSLKAAALARCMPEEQFFPFVSTLYKNEAAWAGSADPVKTLTQYAMLGGLAQDKAKACLENTNLLDAIVAERTEAVEKYNIRATPSFVINRGEEKMTGAQTFEEMAALLDRHLKKGEKKQIAPSVK